MDVHTPSPQVVLNARVRLELVDDSGHVEPAEFILVPSTRADIKSGLLDENAPLARALLNHRAGQTIPYRLGDLRAVRILSVETREVQASGEAAQKRKEAVQKAAAQSEITNQMIFSTASGSKWGDYDVDVDKLLKDKPEE